MKKKLTILLTLFDRDEDTLIWLKKNIFNEFNYFVADGSLNCNNQNIFLNNKFPNLDYKRFSFDSNIKDYLFKLKNSLTLINTEYVMISDNDDFLLKKGLEKIILFLEKNNDYDFCSGNIYYIKRSNNNDNNFFFYLNSLNNYGYEKSSFYKSLKKYFFSSKGCSYLWYSVYKKSFLLSIVERIIENKIFNWHAIEIFHTIYSLKYGNYKYLNTCHYIRQVSINSITSNLNIKENFMELFYRNYDDHKNLIVSIIENENFDYLELKKIIADGLNQRKYKNNRFKSFKTIYNFFFSRFLRIFKLQIHQIRFLLSLIP